MSRKKPLKTLYKVILADSPHAYDQTGVHGAAVDHYVTMTDRQLDWMSADLRPVLADDCVLYYWTTGPKLDRSLQTISAWGFTYKGIAMQWIKANAGPKQCWRKLYELHEARALESRKRNEPDVEEYLKPDGIWLQAKAFFGMGFNTRGNAEYLVHAVRGKGIKAHRSDVSGLIIAPVREHSRKPWEARYRIEAMYPTEPKLELFAREKNPRWRGLGYDIDGLDIRESLRKEAV